MALFGGLTAAYRLAGSGGIQGQGGEPQPAIAFHAPRTLFQGARITSLEACRGPRVGPMWRICLPLAGPTAFAPASRQDDAQTLAEYAVVLAVITPILVLAFAALSEARAARNERARLSLSRELSGRIRRRAECAHELAFVIFERPSIPAFARVLELRLGEARSSPLPLRPRARLPAAASFEALAQRRRAGRSAPPLLDVRRGWTSLPFAWPRSSRTARRGRCPCTLRVPVAPERLDEPLSHARAPPVDLRPEAGSRRRSRISSAKWSCSSVITPSRMRSAPRCCLSRMTNFAMPARPGLLHRLDEQRVDALGAVRRAEVVRLREEDRVDLLGGDEVDDVDRLVALDLAPPRSPRRP